jgi:hypothetical protein
MRQKANELAQIISRFAEPFLEKCHPNSFTLRTLDAIQKCRTSSFGGHKERCDCCGHQRISYNSCRNRHCPKCQAAKQAFWVEDRMKDALDVKYFHVVFTTPHELNALCMTGSAWFYNAMFQCVWQTLQGFGYSHYGVESGAICVLHTWGQNLSLHPHIHCLVPAAGLTLKGNLKRITREGKFLYPVGMLSTVFRGKMLGKIKRHLNETGLLSEYQSLLDKLWNKSWVVDCEPPFGSPKHIVKYLGQYTHRVAISNQRIQHVDDDGVSFYMKDYADKGRQKLTHLSGEEFLHRFCLHILPSRFVRIRYYGILSSKLKKELRPEKSITVAKKETSQERLKRLTKFDIYQCPRCKKGRMQIIEELPRIRSPNNVLYPGKITKRILSL